MKCQQQGVALITAVLIVALVTAVSVAMASRQQVDIRRSANIFSNDQAYLFTLGAEDYARNVLEWDADPAKGGNPDVDHPGENWAKEVVVPVEGAMLKGSVQDMQGRFNLNALVKKNGQEENPVMVARFKRLLKLLGLDQGIADAVVDWIDVDNNPRPGFGGAEEEYYMLQDPPYRAANGPMVSSSELLLIKGVDDEAYRKLAPFVATLPDAETAINVNTAPPEVLATLGDNMTVEMGKDLVEARPESGFDNISQQFSPLINDPTYKEDFLGVKSSYFLVDAVAEFDKSTARLHSLLAREDGKVRVMMRSRGAY
jgi:general secretion pathway protein K